MFGSAACRTTERCGSPNHSNDLINHSHVKFLFVKINNLRNYYRYNLRPFQLYQPLQDLDECNLILFQRNQV